MADDMLPPNEANTEKKAAEQEEEVSVAASILVASKRPGASVAQGEAEEEVPLWLITFTDAIALMLTFFVLLYAMSTPKQESFEAMTMALNQEFGQYYKKKFNAGTQDTIVIDKIDSTRALDLNYLKALMEGLAEKDERLAALEVTAQKDRLIISLPSDLLFDTGAAEVTTQGKRTLYVIGDVLTRIRNKIEIIGHADPRPVSGETFNSNWHLSLARAARVSGVLQSVGYRRNITIRGMSDVRYSELPAEMDEEEKLKLARRVDLVILENDGTRRSTFKLDDL